MSILIYKSSMHSAIYSADDYKNQISPTKGVASNCAINLISYNMNSTNEIRYDEEFTTGYDSLCIIQPPLGLPMCTCYWGHEVCALFR